MCDCSWSVLATRLPKAERLAAEQAAQRRGVTLSRLLRDSLKLQITSDPDVTLAGSQRAAYASPNNAA